MAARRTGPICRAARVQWAGPDRGAGPGMVAGAAGRGKSSLVASLAGVPLALAGGPTVCWIEVGYGERAEAPRCSRPAPAARPRRVPVPVERCTGTPARPGRRAGDRGTRLAAGTGARGLSIVDTPGSAAARRVRAGRRSPPPGGPTRCCWCATGGSRWSRTRWRSSSEALGVVTGGLVAVTRCDDDGIPGGITGDRLLGGARCPGPLAGAPNLATCRSSRSRRTWPSTAGAGEGAWWTVRGTAVAGCAANPGGGWRPLPPHGVRRACWPVPWRAASPPRGPSGAGAGGPRSGCRRGGAESRRCAGTGTAAPGGRVPPWAAAGRFPGGSVRVSAVGVAHPGTGWRPTGGRPACSTRWGRGCSPTWPRPARPPGVHGLSRSVRRCANCCARRGRGGRGRSTGRRPDRAGLNRAGLNRAGRGQRGGGRRGSLRLGGRNAGRPNGGGRSGWAVREPGRLVAGRRPGAGAAGPGSPGRAWAWPPGRLVAVPDADEGARRAYLRGWVETAAAGAVRAFDREVGAGCGRPGAGSRRYSRAAGSRASEAGRTAAELSTLD